MERTHLLKMIADGLQEFGLEPDLVDPILTEAEEDNAPAQFIVASALERSCGMDNAVDWYQRAAHQGYRPALERLRRFHPNAA
jgi:TPR repeat protein